jgi:Tfp pilus assembly protein FimT
VVALLGLVMLVAMPAVQGIGQKRNLEIAARTLATDIRRCQQAAITTGREHYIDFLFDFESFNYRINSVPRQKEERVRFPEGVSYRATTVGFFNGIPRLSFNPGGTPIRVGTVVLQNKHGDVLYVIVTPATGRVRIDDSPPSHW